MAQKLPRQLTASTADIQRAPPRERVLILGGTPDASAFAAACAVALQYRKELYRVDLSALVSKYIGETEKNLIELIGRAEEQNWILFFDEADALFGKRTTVRDSHDRYANLEVSYLLARLEHFRGVAIFAVNREEHIDPALLFRFQQVIRPASKAVRNGRTA